MRILIVALCFAAAAGQAWAEAAFPPVPEPGQAFIAPLATTALLLDGVAVDGRHVVVGAHGIVLISDDGGRKWTQAQTGTRTLLTGVYFHDRELGWVVGHDALILRTEDGGQSWEQVNFDPDDQRPLFDVWFADPRRGIAIGAYGLIMVTDDGGTNWEVVDLAARPWPVSAGSDTDPEGTDPDDEEMGFDDDQFFDYHLNRITAADNGDLFIAAEGGHFFRSRDGGETWYSMPTTYEGSFFNTLVLDDGRLLLMGMRGNLFSSDDDGRNWTQIELPLTVLLNDALRLSDDHLIIVGMAGAVLESHDGGRSFEVLQQDDRKAIAVILAADDAVIVAGESGVRRATLAELRTGASP